MPSLHARPRGRRLAPPPAAPVRGAASLIVVMVLFFVISLVAAYTSRNLIFEQRTSGNQYRSTLAFEAADAGIEWAIARLNSGRMSDDCQPLANAAAVSSPAQDSFRERYLAIDPVNGNITPVSGRLAGCVFDGTDWSCDCPASGEPNPAFTQNGAGPHVAFWVRFIQIPDPPAPPAAAPPPVRPGIVRVEVNACTRRDPDCLRFTRTAQSGDGLAMLSAELALRNGLAAPPGAPLTVRGNGTAGAGTLVVRNEDPASDGTTIHSGRALAALLTATTLTSLPGTPAARSVIENDASLQLPDLAPPLSPATPANNGADRMFNRMFGMWPGTYEEQPGAAVVSCAGGCDASDTNGVVDAALLEPGHVIVVAGGGTLRIDANVGGAASPVVIVARGSVEFAGGARVYGLIYSRAATWTTGGAGTVQGGIVAEQDLHAQGSQTLVYDAAILNRLRHTTGSFVRIAGGWRDFAR